MPCVTYVDMRAAMKVVDADDIARRLGVCRKTVISAAEKAGGVEYLGNKAYLRSDALRKSLGGRYDCLAPEGSIATPVRGKHLTLQETADFLGCSRSTILRVIKRTGLGVAIGGRRYVPEGQVESIKKNILAPGITTAHSNRRALSELGKRMARARWGK